MTTLETLKWDGKKSGKVTLDLAVAKETSSADLIHRAVLRQLANKRQGTASSAGLYLNVLFLELLNFAPPFILNFFFLFFLVLYL